MPGSMSDEPLRIDPRRLFNLEDIAVDETPEGVLGSGAFGKVTKATAKGFLPVCVKVSTE